MNSDTSASSGADRQLAGASRRILWWGRSDPEYARNQILRRCLVDSGFVISDFRPLISAIGDAEAAMRVDTTADLVWVPCFRQRDLAAARRWSARRGLPLVFDPLISAYDKQIFERRKVSPSRGKARRLLEWEKGLFAQADRLLADTQAHAEFFHRIHEVPRDRIRVVPLCADEELFKPTEPRPAAARPLEVLFFGSFIPLQGPQVIIEAANRYRGAPVRWTLVGDGPLRADCHTLVRPGAPIRFVDWLPYPTLPSRIAEADVVLGIFGDTPKAARVVPNKFCQALACARPLITRGSPAFPMELASSGKSGITWVPPADPEALSLAVAELAASPDSLATRGRNALETYRRYFSAARAAADLESALRPLFGCRGLG